MISYEKSCGAVIYTVIDHNIKYVIIKSTEGIYGFPKGHMEKDESEIETARREIFEEVGLKVNFISGFRTVNIHSLPKKKNVMKKVVYFLAKYDNQEIKYQEEELLGAYLMNYDEAINSFQYEDSKRILTEADNFIKKNLGDNNER